MATYRFSRLLRLSTFQIGSAMGDIVVTSIWNRIMISNYHIPASLVGLLIAIRYLLAPLAMWAGYKSDRTRILGLRRSPFIWAGRALIILALPLLTVSVSRFAVSPTDVMGWMAATGSALLYGVGTLISGGPFLALVRDSVPPERRGFALSTVETSLIICFALAGIGFSLAMPDYSAHSFAILVAVTAGAGGFFWAFAISGAEQPEWDQVRPLGWGALPDAISSPSVSKDLPEGPHGLRRDSGFAETFGEVIRDVRTRRFFIFLALATFAAWIQDAILEPFGADTFNFGFARTTRFNSYWQFATVVALLLTGALLRKRRPEDQTPIARMGLFTMAAGMAGISASAFVMMPHLVEFALMVYGLGFGIYTFGGLSMMAAMSPNIRAGAYLGLWSIAILLFKGLGTLAGGALRDFFLSGLGLDAGSAYGLVFLLAAAGLAGASFLARGIDVAGFSRESAAADGKSAGHDGLGAIDF